MKHLLSFLIAATTVLTGCTTNDDITATQLKGGTNTVKFSIATPDALSASRADANAQPSTRSSAMGGLTNVDMTQYDLRYKLSIYKKNATTNNYEAVEISGTEPKTVITTTEDTYKDNVEITAHFLEPNTTYTVVCWADFVQQGDTSDLHYATNTLQNITCKDAETAQLNDESRDAYFIHKEFTTTTNVNDVSLTLRRPFAKLRLVTTDWGKDEIGVAEKFRMTYFGCKRFTNINALTGESAESDLDASCSTAYTGNILKDNTAKDEKYYGLSYDASSANRTLVVDYLMTKDDGQEPDATGTQTPIHFKFEALDANDKPLTGTTGVTVGTTRPETEKDADGNTATDGIVDTEIPIRRNYLTTILGNFLKPLQKQKFLVSINQGFYGEYVDGEPWWDPKVLSPTEPQTETDADGKEWYLISNRDEFAWLAENSSPSAPITKNIKLTADIDMNNITTWKGICLAKPYSVGEYGVAISNASVVKYTADATFDGQNHVIRNFYIVKNVNTTIAAAIIPKIGYVVKAKEHMDTDGDNYYYTVKDVTFENITLRGLHENDSKDITAIIGEVGDYKFENINANHVFIHIKDKGGIAAAIVGHAYGKDDSYIKLCNVNDLNLYCQGGSVVCGGIVGLHSYDKCLFQNNHVNGMSLHYSGTIDDIIAMQGNHPKSYFGPYIGNTSNWRESKSYDPNNSNSYSGFKIFDKYGVDITSDSRIDAKIYMKTIPTSISGN